MTTRSVARRDCKALQDPRGPAQFPGRLENAPFYQRGIHQPSSNSVPKCEVLKAEDLRQPQLIEFEIRSLGFCLGHKPGCQEVSGSTSESGFRDRGFEPRSSRRVWRFLPAESGPTTHATCGMHATYTRAQLASQDPVEGKETKPQEALEGMWAVSVFHDRPRLPGSRSWRKESLFHLV